MQATVIAGDGQRGRPCLSPLLSMSPSSCVVRLPDRRKGRGASPAFRASHRISIGQMAYLRASHRVASANDSALPADARGAEWFSGWECAAPARLNGAQAFTVAGIKRNVLPPLLYVLAHREHGAIAAFEGLADAKRELNELLRNEPAWTGDFTIEPRSRPEELPGGDHPDGGVGEAGRRPVRSTGSPTLGSSDRL